MLETLDMNKLPTSTIKLISSSQVISEIKGVVKELVENSIDAGCDCIDVKLEQYGIGKIEICDNGPGVNREYVNLLCQPYFTSKLSRMDDLQSLQTLGFRGEALHSICTVSDITITTRTKRDSTSTVYKYNELGAIVDCKPSHHNVGTTVSVTNLFKNLPVRKQYYQKERNCKEELKKIEELLVSLSFIYPHIRWTLKNDKTEIWRKNRTKDLYFSLLQRFGSTSCQELAEIFIKKDQFTIHGFVPKKDCNSQIIGRSIGDRIYISVNGRPVVHSEIKKTLKELFNEYCMINNPGLQKYPVAVLQCTLSPNSVDVNLEPNKTKVFLHNTEEIINALQEHLGVLYGDQDSSGTNIEATVSISPFKEPLKLSKENVQSNMDSGDFEISSSSNIKFETEPSTPKFESSIPKSINMDLWSKGRAKKMNPTSVITPFVCHQRNDAERISIQKKRKLASPPQSTTKSVPPAQDLEKLEKHLKN